MQMAIGFLPSIIRSDFGHLVYASTDESLNAFDDQIADAIELFPSHQAQFIGEQINLYLELYNTVGQC